MSDFERELIERLAHATAKASESNYGRDLREAVDRIEASAKAAQVAAERTASKVDDLARRRSLSQTITIEWSGRISDQIIRHIAESHVIDRHGQDGERLLDTVELGQNHPLECDHSAQRRIVGNEFSAVADSGLRHAWLPQIRMDLHRLSSGFIDVLSHLLVDLSSHSRSLLRCFCGGRNVGESGSSRGGAA